MSYGNHGISKPAPWDSVNLTINGDYYWKLIKTQLVELAFKHMGMYNQQKVGDETSTTQYKIRGFVSK